MRRIRDKTPDKDDDLIHYQVSASRMMALYYFCMKDKDIAACLYRKHVELFKSEWTIELVNVKTEARIEPALLNDAKLKGALQAFLLDASDMLLLFNFFGYYCVKDVPAWLEEDPFRIATELPFGLIPMRASGGVASVTGGFLYGSYELVIDPKTMREEVRFECEDDRLKARYDFHVFSDNARFVPTAADGCVNLCGASLLSEVMPVSIFLPLYQDRSLIEEAMECQADANFMASHPVAFQTAKPLPDAKIDSLTEDYMFSMDSMLDAQQVDSARKQMFAIQSAAQVLNKMNATLDKGAAVQPEDLIYNQRRYKYRRPTVTEGLHTIPDNLDVSQMQTPASLIDIADRQRRYENDVCGAIRVPFILFKYYGAQSSGALSGGSVNEEQINFYRNVLYEEVINQQECFNTVFQQLYEHTYGTLEQYVLKSSAIVPTLTFNNVITKSNVAILNLLALYNAGTITREYLQKHIFMLYGEADEKEMKGHYITDLPPLKPVAGAAGGAAAPEKKKKDKPAKEKKKEKKDKAD